jgi:hypothetical protein
LPCARVHPRPPSCYVPARDVLAAGRVEEGLSLLAEALTVLEARGQSELRVEAYRLRGEFLLLQAMPDAT